MSAINKEPLGDARIQVTAVTPSQGRALLTVRGKDHDVTPDDLRAIASACTEVADWVERHARGGEQR